MKNLGPKESSSRPHSNTTIQQKAKNGKPEEENVKGSLVQRSIADQAKDKSIQRKASPDSTEKLENQ